jgi:Tol biopolymer transport system component
VLSPDGRKIAFTGDAPGGVTVFVMDADGSQRRQVVKEVNHWGAVFPDWSPDGKSLVYSFKVGEGLELFIWSTPSKWARVWNSLPSTPTAELPLASSRAWAVSRLRPRGLPTAYGSRSGIATRPTGGTQGG